MFLLNILEAVLAYDLVKIRFMKEKEVILNGNTNDKSRGIQLIGPGYFQRVIKGVNWLLSPIHPVHNKIYNRTSATGSDSDQPALPRSLRAIQILINKNPCHTGWMYRLIRVFAGRRGLIVGAGSLVTSWLYLPDAMADLNMFCSHIPQCHIMRNARKRSLCKLQTT